jgi:hypothetical protein
MNRNTSRLLTINSPHGHFIPDGVEVREFDTDADTQARHQWRVCQLYNH